MTSPELVVREPLAEHMAHVLDHLAGMYFWWDKADPVKRAFYHGRVTGNLDGGYYLVAFDRSDKLPTGLHEVVHVSTMVEDNWSFYRERVEMCAAIVGKESDSRVTNVINAVVGDHAPR